MESGFRDLNKTTENTHELGNISYSKVIQL